MNATTVLRRLMPGFLSCLPGKNRGPSLFLLYPNVSRSLPERDALQRLAPRERVGLEDLGQRARRRRGDAAQGVLDHGSDRGEANAPGEERLDRDLVRGVQHRGRGAAGAERGVRESQARKALGVEPFEREALQPGEVERF